MNNDMPSPETISMIGECLKLAALLDDKIGQPDKGRILAWSKQIEKFKFIRNDLLDGMQAFYEQPRERAMGVGDLIHHARLIRRERMEEETDELERRRQMKSDEKAAQEFRDVMAGAIMGRVNETPRLRAAKEALQNCYGKQESIAAITEFWAAKADAKKNLNGKAAGS